jgi:hypothetical protein
MYYLFLQIGILIISLFTANNQSLEIHVIPGKKAFSIRIIRG